MGTVANILGPTFSVLASLLFTLLMSLQMSLTADAFTNWYADLIPPDYSPELNGLMMNIRQIWTGFLRGQMTLMLFIGIIIWLGATILGLPQAILLGVIAGVMELIPNVGPTLAAIPAVLLALLFGSANFEINHLVFALIVDCFLRACPAARKSINRAENHGGCCQSPDPGRINRHHRGCRGIWYPGCTFSYPGDRHGEPGVPLYLWKDHGETASSTTG